MKPLNLRPAFRYRFLNLLGNAGIFYGVMVLVTAVVTIGATISFNGQTVNASLAAYGFAACITVFVFGIVTVREDLRLGIQHGISRRTTFVSGLLATLSVCFILAVAGELLLAVSQALAADYENLQLSDLYQALYADWQLPQLSFGQHLEAVFFNLAMMLCADMAGMFISLVFFRLNKVWTVIVAVGAPVFLFVVLPILIDITGLTPELSRILAAFAYWVLSSPWKGIFCFTLAAAAIAFFNGLLMRRAPINGAKR